MGKLWNDCPDYVRTNGLRAWMLATRPRTLTGAAAPVLIGASCALTSGLSVSMLAFACCLLFAFVMQIDANFVNDYFDFKKGTDRTDRLGPERACAQGWVTPRAMRFAILLTTLMGCLCGLPLIAFGGWWMLLVGATCVAGCILYTTYLSYRGWGDVLVVVFFGLVPVFFTYWCMCGYGTIALLSWQTQGIATNSYFSVLSLGLAMGFATDCLLMVNNYRDVEQDKVSGKRTFVVRFGREAGLNTYLWFGILAALIVAVTLLSDGARWYLTLPLLLIYILLHISTARKMQLLTGRALNRVLGLTARNIFVFGVLTALACWIR